MGGVWKGQTWLSWGGGNGPWCELWPPRTGAWGHADPCPFPSQPSVSLPCASPILALLPAELQGLPEGLMGVAVGAEPPQKAFPDSSGHSPTAWVWGAAAHLTAQWSPAPR